MPGPTDPNQLNDITFESGVDGNGAVASPAFADWNANTSPATYNSAQELVAKWHNSATGSTAATSSAAGTASGTITYAFGNNVTAAEQTAFTNTLTLWSDEAGLTFTQVASNTTSDVVFRVANSGGTANDSTTAFNDSAGQTAISSFLTPDQAQGGQDTITFDKSGGYGQIGDFTTLGGYGVGALTHEIGHMIGLGHSGPYNDGGGVNPDTAQLGPFDSRQWSVMSYIDPSDTKAKYAGQYTVTGTKWSTTQGNSTSEASPETPMMDDILAAQRLYGASTSTTLSGGQVFGFNCNITDGAKSFFDFNTNVNPVITLFDTGTGNTFDCSGFSTNCTINLNPGTFSTASAGTLTNNIGIAYDTRIDTAIGGSGNDTFTVNTDADTINGGGGSNTAVFSGARSAYVIGGAGPTTTVTNTSNGVVDTLSNIQTLQFADQSVPVCYAAGTRIATSRGEVAVEDLAIGDLAVTSAGALRPIRWLGHRTLDCRRHPRPEAALPIRIAAGAFGPGRPARDLAVSPGHAICIDIGGEVLIPAAALVNGTTITQLEVASVTYWHVELDSHDILLAENLAAESYIECGNRGFFVESGIVAFAACPDAAAPTGYCRPFHAGGPLVDAVGARLGVRAAALSRTARAA